MRVLWVSLVIILFDQVAKLAVLKTMVRSRSIPILGDWLKLTYTENPGMAFGVEFGPPAMISILSIIATTVIIGYLFSIRSGYRPYRVSLALVLGGAIGNIIDRVAYGRIFYDMPLFQGRVVDFFHLDVWRGYLPDWLPFFGGRAVALFPIGNIADLAIIAGVVGIILYQKRFHDHDLARRVDAAGSRADAAVDRGTSAAAVVGSTRTDSTAGEAKPVEPEASGAAARSASPEVGKPASYGDSVGVSAPTSEVEEAESSKLVPGEAKTGADVPAGNSATGSTSADLRNAGGSQGQTGLREDQGSRKAVGGSPIGAWPADLGAPGDIGLPDDAASPAETGRPKDTGQPKDTGRPKDTGQPKDTGRPKDTGQPKETGRPKDTGQTKDTGQPKDTGSL